MRWSRPGILEVGGVRWWLGPGRAAGEAGPVLARALEALAGGGARNLRTGRRKELYALALGAPGEPDHLLKVSRYRGRLRGSKARHELRTARALAGRGVATPVPLAAGERRRAGLLRACYLLVPLLPGAVDLAAHWRRGVLAPAERRALARGFGALARRLHDAGLRQDDFAPNNFLVRPGDPPALLAIDFERARLGRRPASRRARVAMLAKLERRVGVAASASDRLRFLRAYAGDAGAARLWWSRLAAAAPGRARRDLEHWLRTATRDGRRFVRVAHGRWQGFARREADLAVLAGEAERLLAGARGPGVHEAPGAWCVVHGARGRRAAARLWARAQLLFDGRGLAPRPLALLADPRATLLFLERDPAARSAAPGSWEGPAARCLRARLAAIGELDPNLPAEALAFVPGPGGRPRALLLDPARWQPRRG